MQDRPLRVLSLGAGVQSTTLALMSATGDLPPLDRAIFADTGSEPHHVYAHLAWLMEAGRLPFPVDIVKAPGLSLGEEIFAAASPDSATRPTRGSFARAPFYIRDDRTGNKGMVKRQCTGDYKVDPIYRHLRTLLGIGPRSRWPQRRAVEMWMGISMDEISRMRDSRFPMTIANLYPLIDLGFTRVACLDWLEARGYPLPPKSACTFCPYRSDRQFRDLKDNDPEGWAEAVRVDEAIRTGLRDAARKTPLQGQMFVHRSLVPLAEVDLSSAEERGQPNLFNNECEGMCGV